MRLRISLVSVLALLVLGAGLIVAQDRPGYGQEKRDPQQQGTQAERDRSAQPQSEQSPGRDRSGTQSDRDRMQSGQSGREHEKHGQQASGKQGAGNAQLEARLVDEQQKAQNKAAAVEVNVRGVKLMDPDQAKKRNNQKAAHIHYQVDDGPIVATTAKKLDFHNLSSGQHTIKVMLADPDHQPLGAEETLNVNIP